MNRVTVRMLASKCERINKALNRPVEYLDSAGKVNVGHFHFDHAYSGYAFCETVNAMGGVRNVFGNYRTRREALDSVLAFMSGLETALGVVL